MSRRDDSYAPPAHGFRTFVFLWAFQSLAAFGFQITGFALTVWLTTGLYPGPEQKGLLATALSMVSLAYLLPNVLLAPLAGVLVDRADRKTVMFWANVGSALVSLSLVLVLSAGALRLWTVLAAMVLYGSLQCLNNSAFETSYAMLVPLKDLPRANGMMQTVMALAGILTPGVAAGLMALPSLAGKSPDPGWLARLLARVPHSAVLPVAADAMALVIAAAGILYLRIPSPPASMARVRPSLVADIKEGLAFIGKQRGLLWLLATFAVVNFCSAPMGVLRPMIVRDNLARDYARLNLSYESALALVNSAGAIGGVVGGIAVATWGGLKRKRVYGMLVPLLVGGVAQVLFGLSTGIYVTVAATVLNMFAIPFANSHSQAIWQTLTPHGMQGRVFAVRKVAAQFTAPLGTALSGALGAIDPGLAVAACGIVASLTCVLQFLNRNVTMMDEDRPVTVPADNAS
jgi:DHA3 family macrolide efflux protein-like MFS transporter